MAAFPILSFLTWFPLVGALVVMAWPGRDGPGTAAVLRWVALAFALVEFVVSLVLWFRFDIGQVGYQFTETHIWFPEGKVGYRLGVDGLSVLFVLLSTFLIPLCFVSAWRAIQMQVREFLVAFLAMETILVGMFCAADFVLFYVFFEGVLIPMFIIIGVWGGERRVYSAYKFFLFTLTGSVLMLLALLAMWQYAGTTDIAVLTATKFPPRMQTFLFLAVLASFAIKIPMWPVHTWLPDAHVEAPTSGSVVLAAILLKMGGYGLLRFSVPMLPDACTFFAPLMIGLSIVAVVYTSLVAFAQTDMKKLIAYSSVAHMGVVTMGIFTFTVQGLDGSMYQMLSHGIVSAALFLCVGVVYDRLHTHEIARFDGLAHRMPLYAFVFMVFTLASVGVPGMSGFVGEFLVLIASLGVNIWVALSIGSAMILGIVYALYLYRRMMLGSLTKPGLATIRDLSLREVGFFVPLIVLTFWMGVYPSSFGRFFSPNMAALAERHAVQMSRPAVGYSPPAAPGSLAAR